MNWFHFIFPWKMRENSCQHNEKTKMYLKIQSHIRFSKWKISMLCISFVFMCSSFSRSFFLSLFLFWWAIFVCAGDLEIIIFFSYPFFHSMKWWDFFMLVVIRRLTSSSVSISECIFWLEPIWLINCVFFVHAMFVNRDGRRYCLMLVLPTFVITISSWCVCMEYNVYARCNNLCEHWLFNSIAI